MPKTLHYVHFMRSVICAVFFKILYNKLNFNIMKAITKKEFTKACFREIESMNNEELEAVRKGFYTLFNKLKMNGRTLDFIKLNSSSNFLIEITCKTTEESIKRITNSKELPY